MLYTYSEIRTLVGAMNTITEEVTDYSWSKGRRLDWIETGANIIECGRFINPDDTAVLDMDYENSIEYNLCAYCWKSRQHGRSGWVLAQLG